MKLCLTVLSIFVILNCIDAQRSWHFVASGGLVELRTKNPQVKINGRFFNGWRVDANFRIYRNRFYLNPGIDFRTVSLVSSTKIEVFKNQAASYSFGIPLLAGYDVVRNSQFKFRVLAGFHGNYVFRIDQNTYGITKEIFHPFSLSYTLGFGVDFYPVAFDFRYERGLINYYKEPDYKANYFCFTLGFLLDK